MTTATATEKPLFGAAETRQARKELAELDRLEAIASDPGLTQVEAKYRNVSGKPITYWDPRGPLCRGEHPDAPYYFKLMPGAVTRAHVGDRAHATVRGGVMVLQRLEGDEAAAAVCVEDAMLFKTSSASFRAAEAMHASALAKITAAQEALARATRELESAVDVEALAADTKSRERVRLDAWLAARSLEEQGVLKVLDQVEEGL